MSMETADEAGIAGSISRLYTADMAIILAQTKDEKEDEIMRLFVTKNRNGPALRTVKIATDFAHMTFYRGEVADAPTKTSYIDDTEAHEELTQIPEDVLTGDVVMD